VSRVARATLVGAAAVVGLMMAVLLVARPVGYRTVVVHGPSMGKSVPSGSLVVGRLVRPGSVHVGDVIVVRESVDGAPNTPKVHRVTSIVEDGGQTLVTTKGDANSAADPVPYVLPSHTLRIVTTIPFVGRLVRFVGSPVGWLLLIVVPAISLSAAYLQRLWRKDPVPATA
jgi:signal peptidase I